MATVLKSTSVKPLRTLSRARPLSTSGPPVSKKGIDVLIAVFKHLDIEKAKQSQAAIQAQASAKSHETASANHAAAGAAATEAAVAYKAAAKDEKAENLNQKSSAADKAVDLKSDTASSSNSMFSVLLWSGAKLQNPYSINNGSLKANHNNTDGFLTLELMHRHVTEEESDGFEDRAFYLNGTRRYGNEEGGWDFFIPTQVFPDLDFRVGYLSSTFSSAQTLS